MFKKKGNLFLIIALLALVGAYVFITSADKKKGERNFKTELVDIDIDNATKVVIKSAKNDTPLELNKEGDNWMVTLEDGSKVQAMDNAVESTFKELEGIKTSQLAAKSTDKWAEYKVDDQGTNVEVYEGSNKALDIIIGKFDIDPQSLQQQGGQFGGQSQPKFTSYVRLQGENEVFAVKGFYESLNSQTADNYRDKAMFKANREDISKVNFNYTDSAYQLVLADSLWIINDKPADSTKVAQYLNTLSTITGSQFLNKPSGSSIATIAVETKDGKTTTFNAYDKPAAATEGDDKEKKGQEYIVSSDALSNSYFDATSSSLFKRVFVGKVNFKASKK